MSQWPVERRSGRLELAVPVFVYGWSTADDSPFTEITRTLEVNAHGDWSHSMRWCSLAK